MISSFLNRERIGFPSQRIGIGGFSLFARVREKVNFKSTVPVTYVEDGSPLSDHIIRDPEMISIEGVVGDVYEGQSTISLDITPVVNTLGAIGSYVPNVTSFQARIMDGLRNTTNAAMTRLGDLLGAGNQVNNLFGNLDFSSKPLGEQFLDAMENIHYGGQLIAIDMPYRRYENMALTAVVVERDNTGEGIRFSIEAQRVRMAVTNYVEVQENAKTPSPNPSPATGGQTQDAKEMGTQAGENKDRSLLSTYNPFQG